MITIVKIKKGNDTIDVDLDNGEVLKIPFHIMGMFSLEAGRSVDSTEYAQLREESQRYRCKAMALDYLAICPRTALEMERYLGKKKFDTPLVREVVDGLRDAGYIDDADYAARFISNKLNRKLVGKKLLSSELQKKGVSRAIINQALKENESLINNSEALYEMAKKKFTTIKQKKNSIAKLAFFLHSRGFDSDMVSSVIERLTSEDKDDTSC